MTQGRRCVYLRGAHGAHGCNMWAMMKKKETKGEKEGDLETIAKLETGKLYNFEKRKEVVEMIYRISEGFGWGDITIQSTIKTLEKIILHNISTIPEWEVNLLAASVLYVSAQYNEPARSTCHVSPSDFLREAALGPTVSSHRLVSMTQTILNYHTSGDIAIPASCSFLNAAVCSLIAFKDATPVPKKSLISSQQSLSPSASSLSDSVVDKSTQRTIIRICTPDSSSPNLINKGVSISVNVSLSAQTSYIAQKLGIPSKCLEREPLKLYTVSGNQDTEIVTARLINLKDTAAQLGWVAEQQVFACLSENISFMCMSGDVGIPFLPNNRFLKTSEKILTTMVKDAIHMLMKSSQLAVVSLCLCKLLSSSDVSGIKSFIEYLSSSSSVDIVSLLKTHGRQMVLICREADMDFSSDVEERLQSVLSPTIEEQVFETPLSTCDAGSSTYGITPESSIGSVNSPPALLPLEGSVTPRGVTPPVRSSRQRSLTVIQPSSSRTASPAKAPMQALRSMYHNFRSKKSSPQPVSTSHAQFVPDI